MAQIQIIIGNTFVPAGIIGHVAIAIKMDDGSLKLFGIGPTTSGVTVTPYQFLNWPAIVVLAPRFSSAPPRRQATASKRPAVATTC